MSHSTTTTLTHPLAKYSRSYPSASGAQQDWQHYTNPVISLTLDLKKTGKGELNSVRLRVTWTLSGEDTMDLDNSLVSFEDLDLLAYSSVPQQPAQGLPLKAVYRDSVVGIRYMWPHPPPADQPILYRRFQVTFASHTAAAQFIDGIRNICPCQANPPITTPGTLRKNQTCATRASFAPTRKTGTQITTQASLLARSQTITAHNLANSPPPLTPRRFASQLPARFSTPAPRSSSPAPRSSDPDFGAPPPSSSDTFVTARSSFTPQPPPPLPVSGLVELRPQDCLSDPESIFEAQPSSLPYPTSQPPPGSQSSLPPSSLESNSSRNAMPPPPPPPLSRRASSPMQENVPSDVPSHNAPSHTLPACTGFAESAPQTQEDSTVKETFMDSLRATTGLYQLSVTELEALITEVVHEEGFCRLLEQLSLIMGPSELSCGK